MSRWWVRALVWQLSGMGIAVTVLGLAGAVLVMRRNGWDLEMAPWAFAASVVWPALTAVLLMPLTFGAIAAWLAIATRWPAIEASRLRMVAGLSVYALLLASIASLVNSWEELVYPNRGFRALYPGARSSLAAIALQDLRFVLPGMLIGLLVPRLALPPLRAGGRGASSSARSVA